MHSERIGTSTRPRAMILLSLSWKSGSVPPRGAVAKVTPARGCDGAAGMEASSSRASGDSTRGKSAARRVGRDGCRLMSSRAGWWTANLEGRSVGAVEPEHWAE